MSWQVQVANHKLLRRTRNADDRFEPSGGRGPRAAPDRGDCENFCPARRSPSVTSQYMRPTASTRRSGCASRRRAGRVYGSTALPTGEPTPRTQHLRHRVQRAARQLARLLRSAAGRAGATTPAQHLRGSQAAERQVSTRLPRRRLRRLLGVELKSVAGLRAFAPHRRGAAGLRADAFRTVADELDRRSTAPMRP